MTSDQERAPLRENNVMTVIRNLFALALIALWGADAQALPPLEVLHSTAAEELHVWWRAGELMVAQSKAPGSPARWPLDPGRAGQLPAVLVGWTPVGQTCGAPPEARATLDGAPAVARVEGSAELPVITLSRDGARVAQGALGQPATVCAMALVEADAVPGPELLVLWRLDGPSRPLRGLTVMRVPQTAR
ncbi:MAG: hypothetical protein JNM72_18735 [Deltaproteobacteria bacterium]|nr:hypothetical protein [Deltaproteobacteria bacterium]